MLQDSLVEQETQGSFVSYVEEDILTTNIGRPDHIRCVHGTGGSWEL